MATILVKPDSKADAEQHFTFVNSSTLKGKETGLFPIHTGATWNIYNSKTPSALTGALKPPIIDGQQLDWYVFTETSSPTQSNAEFYMEAKDLGMNIYTNLSFMAHLWGRSFGKCSLEVRYVSETDWVEIRDFGVEGLITNTIASPSWQEITQDFSTLPKKVKQFRLRVVTPPSGIIYETDACFAFLKMETMEVAQFKVSGFLVDLITGEPQSNKTLRIYKNDDFIINVATNSEGYFEYILLDTGDYRVVPDDIFSAANFQAHIAKTITAKEVLN